MKRPASYYTKQRDAIVSYLSSLGGTHVTVAHMAEHFKEREIRIGLTTIYRQLDKMVQEGSVKKLTVDGVSGACYQYIDENSYMADHYHLKCEVCGELIHLQCGHIEALNRHIFEHHLFALKPQKTIFYGICNNCESREE